MRSLEIIHKENERDWVRCKKRDQRQRGRKEGIKYHILLGKVLVQEKETDR
jgi:hypothetical protein